MKRNDAVETWKAGTTVTTMMSRETLMAAVTAAEDELREMEMRHIPVSQKLTERRIAVSQMEQELSFVGQQSETAKNRREELERAVAGREEGIRSYEESIAKLTEESGDLFAQLDELKGKAAGFVDLINDERGKRASMLERITAADQEVAGRRAELDQAKDFKGKLEVQAAEAQMRR